MPIVIGYHLIWTIYGYWLPNDPRGSSSRVIRRDILKDLGVLHQGRKRVQPASRDIRAFYARAESKLRFPILDFAPSDTACVAEAFAQVIATMRYTCYACAIMPDHVHLVIRKHKHLAEEMIANFQRASHLLLRKRGLRDLAHPVWGGPGWKIFLDHPDEIRRTIGYVERNPLEIGLLAQVYPFVTPYDGWPLHAGHNANSPYARRMRQPLTREAASGDDATTSHPSRRSRLRAPAGPNRQTSRAPPTLNGSSCRKELAAPPFHCPSCL